MQAAVSVRSVHLLPERGYPFHITAKCYVPTDEVYSADGLTLLLLHSTSFHKEVYEPTLDELLLLIARDKPISQNRGLKIRAAWVIECPNHGESARGPSRLNITYHPHPDLRYTRFLRTMTSPAHKRKRDHKCGSGDSANDDDYHHQQRAWAQKTAKTQPVTSNAIRRHGTGSQHHPKYRSCGEELVS